VHRPTSSPKPPRILIVDDIPQNVDLVRSLMRAEGYEVASASNGLEALAQVASAPPDLILLDIMMPTLDGYAVCRRLKARHETRLVPIVLITALGDEADKLLGIEAGADDFLTKPFSHAELKARIRSLLKLKTFTDELEHAETMLLTLGRTEETRRWLGGRGSSGITEERYATTRSGPMGSGVRITAGRYFTAVRSVNGNGTRIRSPLRSGRVKRPPRRRGSRGLPHELSGTRSFHRSPPPWQAVARAGHPVR